VIAVMIAASNSFITPIGYQTNTFINGPGGYRFGDFVRRGDAGDPFLLPVHAALSQTGSPSARRDKPPGREKQTDGGSPR
jgi:hypothetical protein